MRHAIQELNELSPAFLCKHSSLCMLTKRGRNG